MECMKCRTEMKAVQMIGQGYPIWVMAKKKSIWDSEKLCTVDCWVCPQCGYIELKAEKPELFQNI